MAIAVILFKVEIRNMQRIKTDKIGTFDSVNTLEFYDDRMVVENKELKSTGQLHIRLLNGKQRLFHIYLTLNQASLVRKRI